MLKQQDATWNRVDRLVDRPRNRFTVERDGDVRNGLSARRAFATSATLTTGCVLIGHVKRSRKPSGEYGQHLQPIH